MGFYWSRIMITNYYITIDAMGYEHLLNIYMWGGTHYADLDAMSLRNINKLPYSIIYLKYRNQ